jgi:hypothetical protein
VNISKILAKLVEFTLERQNFPEFPNLMLKNKQNISKIKLQLKISKHGTLSPAFY